MAQLHPQQDQQPQLQQQQQIKQQQLHQLQLNLHHQHQQQLQQQPHPLIYSQFGEKGSGNESTPEGGLSGACKSPNPLNPNQNLVYNSTQERLDEMLASQTHIQQEQLQIQLQQDLEKQQQAFQQQSRKDQLECASPREVEANPRPIAVNHEIPSKIIKIIKSTPGGSVPESLTPLFVCQQSVKSDTVIRMEEQAKEHAQEMTLPSSSELRDIQIADEEKLKDNIRRNTVEAVPKCACNAPSKFFMFLRSIF